MSERSTGVKVTLDESGFKVGAKKLVDEATKAGAGMGKGLSDGLKGGFDKAKAALVTGVSSIRSSLGPLMQIGGIGGAIGMAAFANDAIKTEANLTRVARVLRQAGGEAYTFRDLQQKASVVTKEWGYNADQLGAAVKDVFDAAGDPKTAVDSMGAIAMATRDVGGDMSRMSQLSGSLAQQFGVDGKGMADALAIVIKASREGNTSIDDLSGGMGELGRAAKLAGISGVDGLKQTLALVNQMTTAAGGNGARSIAILAKTFSTLSSDQEKQKQLKALGIDTKGKNGVQLLGELLGKSGGDAAKISKVIDPENAGILEKGLGGGGFAEALKKATESTANEAELKKNAAEQMQTSEAKIEAAMNRLRDKFVEPKFLAAIDKFADAIPKLADVAMKAVDFAADNPMLTGAALAAPKIASFASMLGEAGKRASEAAGACGCGGGGAGGGAGGGGGGGGIGLGTATTAAVLAWGAAGDQWKELSKEMDASKTGADLQANDADLVRNAIASGVEDAVTAGDRVLMPDTGGSVDLGGGEMATTAATGEAIDMTPTGGWGEGERDYALMKSRFAVGAMQQQERAHKMGIGSFLASEGIGDDASLLRPHLSELPARAPIASTPAPAPKQDAASARLLAEMLQSSQGLTRVVQGGLAVDIRNTDQLASALKAGGPGWGPRE